MVVTVNPDQAQSLIIALEGCDDKEGVVIYEREEENLDGNVVVVDFDKFFSQIYPNGEIIFQSYSEME